MRRKKTELGSHIPGKIFKFDLNPTEKTLHQRLMSNEASNLKQNMEKIARKEIKRNPIYYHGICIVNDFSCQESDTIKNT